MRLSDGQPQSCLLMAYLAAFNAPNRVATAATATATSYRAGDRQRRSP